MFSSPNIHLKDFYQTRPTVISSSWMAQRQKEIQKKWQPAKQPFSHILEELSRRKVACCQLFAASSQLNSWHSALKIMAKLVPQRSIVMICSHSSLSRRSRPWRQPKNHQNHCKSPKTDPSTQQPSQVTLVSRSWRNSWKWGGGSGGTSFDDQSQHPNKKRWNSFVLNPHDQNFAWPKICFNIIWKSSGVLNGRVLIMLRTLPWFFPYHLPGGNPVEASADSSFIRTLSTSYLTTSDRRGIGRPVQLSPGSIEHFLFHCCTHQANRTELIRNCFRLNRSWPPPLHSLFEFR